jgi:HPt (histidine-containing phosphotransfer) domain-containing protein
MSTLPGGPNAFKADLTYLRDIASGSSEFMVDMLDIFLQQTPIYFEQLGAAIEQKDWNQVGDIAHKIKPTFAFIGIDEGREVMQAIEYDARKMENLDSISTRFILMKAMCSDLYQNLEEAKLQLQK